MKNLKKFVALVGVVALCLRLAACVDDNSNINTSSSDVTVPIQSQEDEADAALNSTPPIVEGTTPTTKPSICPSNPPDGVDLTAFSQTLLNNYAFGITITNNDTGEVQTSLMILNPNNEPDRPMIDNYYAGLADMTLQQCVVCVNNYTMVEAELVLVQTGGVDDVATVEGVFQARIDYMVGDGNGPGGAWYPQTTETWKNKSRIVSNGTYVMFIVHPTKCDDIVDDFNALF